MTGLYGEKMHPTTCHSCHRPIPTNAQRVTGPRFGQLAWHAECLAWVRLVAGYGRPDWTMEVAA